MRILVAPLNWGLGHASRCIPLIRRLLGEGHDVVLGGDGDSLLLLQHTFPNLPVLPLAPLHLRYSAGNSQVGAMLQALPALIRFSLRDRRLLRSVMRREHFDQIISDNRFGLCPPRGTAHAVYITHQLCIRLPKGWRWLEPLAFRLHRAIYSSFDEVWVPDYADPLHNLSGELAHGTHLPPNIRYIGPLSRFSDGEKVPMNPKGCAFSGPWDVVVVLSGLEPQRTLFEASLYRRYAGTKERVLIVQGKMDGKSEKHTNGNITTVARMDDNDLRTALLQARRIIARSGYSTLLDLDALNLLSRAELIPTPGQPEQEYLASRCRLGLLSDSM